jgi:hypothetical protein
MSGIADADLALRSRLRSSGSYSVRSRAQQPKKKQQGGSGTPRLPALGECMMGRTLHTGHTWPLLSLSRFLCASPSLAIALWAADLSLCLSVTPCHMLATQALTPGPTGLRLLLDFLERSPI